MVDKHVVHDQRVTGVQKVRQVPDSVVPEGRADTEQARPIALGRGVSGNAVVREVEVVRSERGEQRRVDQRPEARRVITGIVGAVGGMCWMGTDFGTLMLKRT